MSFTRSASGVANYKLFFSSDFVVFIEGKKTQDRSQSESTADEFFYQSLLEANFPNQKVKIKCVGNCDDVLKHVIALEKAGDKNGFGIIDRDSEGILYSQSTSKQRILFTNGYSWENDFWSDEIIRTTAGRLILAAPEELDKLRHAIRRGMSRLSFLCRLDFSSRVHGVSLIQKHTKSCGINIKGTNKWSIPFHEIKRFVTKYKENGYHKSDISKFILKATKNQSPDRLVQGHLKQALACNIISALYQKNNKNSSIPHHLISSAALSLFRENPRMHMHIEAYNHYAIEFKRMAKL